MMYIRNIFTKRKQMKFFIKHKLATLLFVASSMCCIITLSGCDELINKAKQLIPDPGSQYNAAEEMRGAQGESDKIRPYAPEGVFLPNNACAGGYYAIKWSGRNAKEYCVNWSIINQRTKKRTEGTSHWIDSNEYEWKVPD